MFSSEDPRFDEHQDDDEKHGAPDKDHDGCTYNRWSSNFERSILQWLDLNLNQGLQRFKVWKLHIFSFHIELWFSRLFDSRKFSIVSIVHPFLRLLVLSKLDVRGCQLSVPDMNVDGAGPLALPPTCLLPSVIYTALSTQPHVSRATCLSCVISTLPCPSLTVQTRRSEQWPSGPSVYQYWLLSLSIREAFQK